MKIFPMTKKTAFSLVELSMVILIVGLIIAAISESSRLISMFRLSNARSLTQSSPINAISDLAIWLETSTKNVFDNKNPNNGTTIALWSDANPQKTMQNDFTQSTASMKPTYLLNGINYIPALHFEGSCPNLRKNNVMTSDLFENNGGSFTGFAVANIHNYSGGGLFRFSSSASQMSFGLSNGVALFNHPSATDSLLGSKNIVNIPVILTFIADSTTKTIRINGSVDASQSQNGGVSDATSIILIGAMQDSGSCLALNMELGELAIFNRALTAKEISDIEKYLSKKWLITITS